MASGCNSSFDEKVLQKALPHKVLQSYNDLRFKANIESANMPDVSTCPKCNYTAIVESNHAASHPSDKIPSTQLCFHCSQCHFKSCRLCHEEYHPNISRCDLVESKNETSGRNKVEEAMTSALVRCCPRVNCQKKFLKMDGCNKMTCPCGCFVCYVCKKEIPKINPYAHFCQTYVPTTASLMINHCISRRLIRTLLCTLTSPHCNHELCGKCPLHADTSVIDAQRIANAANEAAQAVLKTADVNVDVNSLLKGSQPKTERFGRVRH